MRANRKRSPYMCCIRSVLLLMLVNVLMRASCLGNLRRQWPLARAQRQTISNELSAGLLGTGTSFNSLYNGYQDQQQPQQQQQQQQQNINQMDDYNELAGGKGGSYSTKTDNNGYGSWPSYGKGGYGNGGGGKWRGFGGGYVGTGGVKGYPSKGYPSKGYPFGG